MIKQMLTYNEKFVEEKKYEAFQTSKYPDKKIAIVTCMDTRLCGLLPAALGIKNGDVKMIKVAGAIITSPFDAAMRSLLIAVYELHVNEIMIIGHTGCGVQGMNAKEMLELMHMKGISKERINLMRHCGINLDNWLHGFDDGSKAIMETVDMVKNHPLLPKNVTVRGYIIETETGKLNEIVEPNP